MKRRARSATLQSPCSSSVVLAAVASVSDRGALAAIVFVLKSGIPWEMIHPKRWNAPAERVHLLWQRCARLADWQQAGIWHALRRVLLDRLREAGEIDWSSASLDSANDAGQKGGERTGPNPTDKGKTG